MPPAAATTARGLGSSHPVSINTVLHGHTLQESPEQFCRFHRFGIGSPCSGTGHGCLEEDLDIRESTAMERLREESS